MRAPPGRASEISTSSASIPARSPAAAAPILCGRDERRAARAAARGQPVDLGGAVTGDGRESSGRDELGAERSQGREEFLRPADAGEGDHARGRRTVRRRPVPEPRGSTGRPSAERSAATTRRLGADQHDRVGAGKPARERLAQRARRHHPAVAEAVAAVDDDAATESLASVGFWKPSSSRIASAPAATAARDAGGAVARDPARRARGEQQRLVADRGGVVAGGIDPHRAGEAAAIAAGHDVQPRRRCAAQIARRATARPASCRRRRRPDCRRRSPAPARGRAAPAPAAAAPPASQAAPTGAAGRRARPGGSCPELRRVRIRRAAERAWRRQQCRASARARSSHGARRASTASSTPRSSAAATLRRGGARARGSRGSASSARHRRGERRRAASRSRRRRPLQGARPSPAQLLISGPCRTAQSSRAASNGLWPPLATSEPPMNAMPARR